MIKRVFPLLIIVSMFVFAGCGSNYPNTVPEKYSTRKVPACQGPSTKLKGVPYSRVSGSSCAVAIAPFDLGIWNEAPLNSHMVRGVKTSLLGCKPLSAGTDQCVDCATPGHSNTLMMTFDSSVYNEDLTVIRATLAVYSPNNPAGLNSVYLRGRLNVGDELQSLGRNREGVVSCSGTADGWVFYDVSNFVARAIKERRNAVHFELSLPCQSPSNLVSVGVNKPEPRLVVEYQ